MLGLTEQNITSHKTHNTPVRTSDLMLTVQSS